MAHNGPKYQFKWSNYDARRYFDELHEKAGKLRRDAEILLTRAQQIDDERIALETALVPVEEPASD